MSSRLNTYFMMLVGALAGLVAWALVVVLVRTYPTLGQPQFIDVLNMSLLGMFVCALAVGFSDYWSDGGYQPLWVATEALLGFAMGLLAGLAAIVIQGQLGASFPFLSRLIPWTLAGGLIGFGAGARWFEINMYRPVIAVVGGMAGAALGGTVFTFSGNLPPEMTDFVQASAFVFTGVGVTTGITLAPTLLADGLVRFLTSMDPRTRQRCTSTEWPVRQGNRLLIGRLALHTSSSWYGKKVGIHLDDAMVAEQHAYVIAESGRYYIQPVAPANWNERRTLHLNHTPIQERTELDHNAVITVGQTQLRFELRSPRSS